MILRGSGRFADIRAISLLTGINLRRERRSHFLTQESAGILKISSFFFSSMYISHDR